MKEPHLNLWSNILLPVTCLCCLSTNLFSADPVPIEDILPAAQGNLEIRPINHATFVMKWYKLTVYVDPVGGASRFQGLPKPDLILVTHIHGDHFSLETLKGVLAEKTKVVVPQAVADKLPQEMRKSALVMTNGQEAVVLGMEIKAIPAYNTTPARMNYHAKGQGNGYVLNPGGKRIYISGDTEDTPEMRARQNIDVAFLCMNLPYTMTVEQAASAVREFHPKIVYPYHSRGSDLGKFKQLVGADSGVEVRLRTWY